MDITESPVSKHTPGPWTQSRRDSLEIVRDFDSVALLNRALDDAEANARLIAAAPDLLAACMAVVEAQRLAGMDFGRDSLGGACRAAVAKALGYPESY